MPYTQEKQVAIEAVTLASALCQAVQTETVQVNSLEKNDKSPVTVADFGSQALICQRIKAAFPNDPIVGEEHSADLQRPENAAKLIQVTQYVRRFLSQATSESVCRWIDAGNGRVADRFWILDPIDGTKGFLRKEQYAVALALIEHGQVKVAVLGCPNLPLSLDDSNSPIGTLFVAVRGEGALMAALGSNSLATIHVVREAGKDRLRFAESVEADHGNQALQAAVAKAAGITQPPVRMDSQAKYGLVARGDAALYLRLPSPGSPDYREKIWDHAAGLLVIEEAGGRVTDMNGQPLDLASDYKMNHNRGVVASHGAQHAAVLAALARS